MEFLQSLLNGLPGSVGQGLMWGVMAIGVYITYRVLDIADLTVDGSLATGGAVCVLLTVSGVNVWLATIIAMLVGMLAGLVTGLFHTKCGIPAILAGILTQLALYSINLRIMGWGTTAGTQSTLAVSVEKFDLLVSSRYVRELSLRNPILLLLVIAAVVVGLLYWFFGTEIGCGIRATGANRNMARAQGINTEKNAVIGLMISNGIVALAGALIAQYQGSCHRGHGPRRHRHRPCGGHHRRGPAAAHRARNFATKPHQAASSARSSTTSSSRSCSGSGLNTNDLKLLHSAHRRALPRDPATGSDKLMSRAAAAAQSGKEE